MIALAKYLIYTKRHGINEPCSSLRPVVDLASRSSLWSIFHVLRERRKAAWDQTEHIGSQLTQAQH